MVYDFYYSEEHEMHMKGMYEMMNEEYYDTYIVGKKYTEMIEHGKKPQTAHFTDIKLIHTGTDEIVVERAQ